MLEKGDAPATEFEIEPGTDGRFVILWRTDQTPNPSPSTEVIEKEIAGATAEADPPPATTERVGEPSQDPELAAFQTPRLVAELARRGYRSTQPRQRRSAERPAKERRPSKASELDQAATRGVMPEKPIVTSATNQHYQKRFDQLAEFASVGEWAAIAAYKVTGNIPTRRRSRVTATGCWPLTPRRRTPRRSADWVGAWRRRRRNSGRRRRAPRAGR